MFRDPAPGTPGDPEDDGSATAPGTLEDTTDDGSEDGEEHGDAASELARLRRVNQQLLSEKSSGEDARREARELRQLVLDMNRGRGAREEEPDPTEVQRDRALREQISELERSDDPRDQLTLEMVHELRRNRRKLSMLDGTSGAKVSPEDMPGVQQMMETGEFGSIRAAHKAYLGTKLEGMLKSGKLKVADEDSAGGQLPTKPTQKGSPKQKPVSTLSRPVPREKAVERKTITASEYREKLRADDGAEWRRKRLNGDFEVVPG